MGRSKKIRIKHRNSVIRKYIKKNPDRDYDFYPKHYPHLGFNYNYDEDDLISYIRNNFTVATRTRALIHAYGLEKTAYEISEILENSFHDIFVKITSASEFYVSRIQSYLSTELKIVDQWLSHPDMLEDLIVDHILGEKFLENKDMKLAIDEPQNILATAPVLDKWIADNKIRLD